MRHISLLTLGGLCLSALTGSAFAATATPTPAKMTGKTTKMAPKKSTKMASKKTTKVAPKTMKTAPKATAAPKATKPTH